MDRAASTAFRRCLRSGRSINCRKSLSNANQNCIVSSICPERSRRNLTSTSSFLQYPISNPKQSVRRTQELENLRLRMNIQHSRAESTIQGTIGKGETGVEDEVDRIQDRLVAPDHLDEKEKEIWQTLMKELQCTELEVKDISGGCGSMYGIDIVSEKFRGLTMLKQQRLVNQVLGGEIKGWHGVQLKTRAP